MRMTVFTTFFVDKEKLRHFWHTYFSVWHRSKCNFFSIDLLKTCAIFLHKDRQLCWKFYAFRRDTQFWYIAIGNFHDVFMLFNKWCHFFYVVEILHFLGTLQKKRMVPIDTACFPRSETTKMKKLPKTDLRKNSARAMICSNVSECCVCYVFQSCDSEEPKKPFHPVLNPVNPR